MQFPSPKAPPSHQDLVGITDFLLNVANTANADYPAALPVKGLRDFIKTLNALFRREPPLTEVRVAMQCSMCHTRATAA